MRYTTLILVMRQFHCGNFKRGLQLYSLPTADLGDCLDLNKQIAVD